MALRSGLAITVAVIDTYDGPVDEAFPPMSVTVAGGMLVERPRD